MFIDRTSSPCSDLGFALSELKRNYRMSHKRNQQALHGLQTGYYTQNGPFLQREKPSLPTLLAGV